MYYKRWNNNSLFICMINLTALKIHQLHSLIDWLNKNHSTQFEKLPLNKSSLENNSWFSGFVDSDGSFSVQYTNTDSGAKKRKISCRLRIEQRVLDPITSVSYFDILNQICLFLNCNLLTKTKHGDYYTVYASNEKSLRIILDYFNKYPLYSSKYLDYMDWKKVVNYKLNRTCFNEDISKLIIELKAGMNTNRKIFNWDHLRLLNMERSFIAQHDPRPCWDKKVSNNYRIKFSEQIRTFSTSAYVLNKVRSSGSTNSSALPELKVLHTYKYVDLDKLLICRENKGKAGVYRWINLTNGKSYVGSSTNLGRRFTEYFSLSFLERAVEKSRSNICAALLKYGYSNFSLEILEYSDVDNAIAREQYYLDILEPEYNILSMAGSSLGHIHSDETKLKMSLTWTDERRAKHLEHLKRINSSPEHKEQLKLLNLRKKGSPRPEGAGTPSVKIEVVDTLTQEKMVFTSISEAARAIGFTKEGISVAFKRQKEKGVEFIFIKKKRYMLKKID